MTGDQPGVRPLALGLLVLLPILVHLPVLNPWLTADPILWWSGLARSPGPGLLVPGLPGWADGNAGVTTEALGHLAADDWLHGIVPWWNPYSGVGMPLAAEMQNSALFLPFVLLLHLPRGVLLLKITLQLLTGLATLGLLRTLRITPAIAGLVALLAEFNGTFAWYAHAPIMPVAFLPLLLLGIERCRLAAVDRRPAAWRLVAIAIAMSIYAGFPETAFLDTLFALVFALARLPATGRARYATALASGLACGLLLSAPAWVPFLDYLPHAFVGEHADEGRHLLPGSPAMLLLPYIFGTILFGNLTTGTGQAYWWTAGGYVSLPLILLALFALPGGNRRPLRLALGAWLIASFAKAAGYPPAAALWNLIPFIRHALFPVYIAPSWEFAVLLLAAFALDDWRNATSRARAVAALSFALSLAAVALGFAIPEIIRLTRQARDYLPIAASLTALTIAATIAVGLLLAGPPTRRRLAALCLLVAAEALLDFTVPLLSAARTRPLDDAVVAYLRAHLGLRRFYGVGVFGPNYGAYERLAAINHNALPVPRDWIDYLHAHFGQQMNGVEFFGRAIRPLNVGGPEGLAQAAHPDIATVSIVATLSGLGVRYVLARHDLDPFTDLAGVAVLLRDPRPLPLPPGSSTSFVLAPPKPAIGTEMVGIGVAIGTYVRRSDGSLSITLCSAGICRHARRDLRDAADNEVLFATLDRPLRVEAGQLSVTLTHQGGTVGVAIYLWPTPTIAAADPLLVLRYRPPGLTPPRVYADKLIDIYALNDAAPYAQAESCHLRTIDRRTLIADCDRPARLIRRELFFPGWRVAIDGRPATLERAGGLFQSVALPSGRSTVRFSYRPPFLVAAIAAMLSGLAWLALSSRLPTMIDRLARPSGNRRIALLYVALGAPTAASLAVINPPFQCADEGAHFARAVQVGQGGLLATRHAGDDAGGKLPASLRDLIASLYTIRFHPHAPPAADAEAAKWSGPLRWIGFLNTAIYPPWFYLPQAVAIDIGRAAGLHVLDCLTLARLANAASAIALAALAIASMSAGAAPMAAVLSLPMTLSLFASCGQDALVIAGTALAAAFLSRRTERVASWAAWLGIGLLLGAIGAARAPYLLLAALPLVIARHGPDHRRGFAASLVAAAIAVLWLRFGAAPLLAPTHAGGSILAGAQLAFLRAHPLDAVRIAIATLRTNGVVYVREFVGVLNWLDVELPPTFYRLAVLILIAVSLLALAATRRPTPTPPRAIIATLLLATAAGIFASLYLTWTSVGAPIVDGVQGRYFIPLALMATLLLRPGPEAWPTRLSVVLVAVLLISDLAIVPALIGAHYAPSTVPP